jgi:hypothetical protein
MATRKYESDAGSVHVIRLSPIKAAIDGNTEPDGDVDSPIKVKISKSNREFGIRPRGVRISIERSATEGETTVTRVDRAFIPILSKTVFESDSFAPQSTITYKEEEWKVAEKIGEDF